MIPRIGEGSGLNGLPNNGSSTTNNGGKTNKVNINTADIKELDSLPGVGPSTAERIIAYRNEKGSFKRPEDLKEVPGIGDKKYAQMADLIRVD